MTFSRPATAVTASLTLAFLLLIPATAHAVSGNLAVGETMGDSMNEASSESPLETVVVTASRREETLFDITGAVSVVTSEDINRLAPEMLAEMMRGVPGAFFQQTTPGQGIPIIRGLKGSQILHLVDGMRLNNAFFRNAPNQYLGLVDAYATSRTEVIRGSAPSLYGADAMGGVLAIHTREPEHDSSNWTARGHLYATWNSVDSGFIGRAEGSAGTDATVISGGVTYHDHGDRKIGGGDTVRPTAYRVKAADFKFRQRWSDRHELMLSYQFVEQPSSPRIDELIPGYGQDTPSSEQYEFRPNSREFLHARYRLDSDARWFSRFEAHLARQVITDDRLTQDWGSPLITEESNDSTLDGLTLQFNSPWGKGSELVWGLEIYQDEVSSQRFRTDSDNGQVSPRRGRFPDGSTMDSSAVYLSNHWAWDRWSLDAGLRYSWFDIRLPATDEIEAVKLKPSDLTGDIHLGFDWFEGGRLVANLGRGFRPPNIFDLGTLGSRPGNRFNIPNPDLDPESVWSYDLGLKVSRGNWQAEVYAWYLDYQDKISSRFTGEQTPGGRDIVRSDNLNSVDLYGLETGLRYRSSEAVEWFAVLNYTRGDEEEPDGTTTPADRIPPLNGRLGVIWEPGLRWRLESFIDFASRQDRLSPRDADDPRINPDGTAGWASLNALVSYELSSRTLIGLRLQNLGDRNYREHGSGIDAPGRNIGLWLDVKLPE